jgi:predicted permease
MGAFLRKLIRRRRLEQEMHEELAFHSQARADDLVRSGVSAAEALRRARLEFGGTEQYTEQLRDARHLGWIEDLLRDLAYACRNLRRSPIFAFSAAGAIALGIGVNTALFSLVYGVLFRPLPVRDPGTIRNIYMSSRGKTGRRMYGTPYFVSFAEYTYLRDHARTALLAGVAESDIAIPSARAPLHAQLASDNLLALTAPPPALGRYFLREEAATPGASTVAVLSYDAWQKYFNGENVVGRGVNLNRTSFTIVGVAGRGYYGPLVLKADLWIPLTMQAITRAGEPLIGDPNCGWIQIIGRMRPGATDAGAASELQVLAQQTLSSHAWPNRAGITVSPGAFLNYPDVMSNSVPVLAVLSLAVSLVLLVACANVANMLVARGFSRGRELAIRLSIGAGKGRIVRQLLTEHMLVGLLGGVGGLALSQVAIRALMAGLPELPDHQLNVSPDWRVALWTVAVALAAGALFGLPAALGITRGDLTRSLRGDPFDCGVPHGRLRLQTALIVTQVAVSAILLINAGILVRAANRAIHLDPGLATSGVLIAKPNLRELQYTPAQAERYFRELRDRAAALPGVTAVSWTGFEPVTSSCGAQAQAVRPDGSVDPFVRISCDEIGADFLRVMHIRLLQGRAFAPSDEHSAAKVAIVDESFARLHLPGNPLGRRIRMGGGSEDDREIVGVVASTKPLGIQQGAYPQVYSPLAGLRFLEAHLVVAYDGPRGSLAHSLQAIGPELDRESSLTVKAVEENVSAVLSFVRLAAGGVAALGALALLLACTGVYGVVAFTVGRRRREIGIRIALGASADVVMRQLIRQSLRPVLIGSAIGTGLAAISSRLIRTMLYGVSPLDPGGFAAGLILLAAVAAIAALVPASAALRVDPAATLRHD